MIMPNFKPDANDHNKANYKSNPDNIVCMNKMSDINSFIIMCTCPMDQPFVYENLVLSMFIWSFVFYRYGCNRFCLSLFGVLCLTVTTVISSV